MHYHEAPITDDLFELYMQQVHRVPLLSAAKEKELGYLAQAGDSDARRQLIVANLRLVVLIVNRHFQTTATVSRLDLVQAGNIGLMNAVDRFRPELGFRLSTFANRHIHGVIARELNARKLIHVPVETEQQIKILLRTREILEQQLNRQPSAAELADTLSLDEVAVRRLLHVWFAMRSQRELFDSDASVDTTVADTEHYALNNAQIQQVQALLDDLPAYQRQIIKMRFGFDNGHCHSYAEIAHTVGRSYGAVMNACHAVLKRCCQSAAWQACNDIN